MPIGIRVSRLFFYLLLVTSSLVACNRPPESREPRSAVIGERVAIEIPRRIGRMTVTLNGEQIAPAASAPGKIFVDLAIGDPSTEMAVVVVKFGRRAVLEETFELQPVEFASSELVVSFKGISKEELVDSLADTIFTLVPDSYVLEERTNSGVALLDIGAQSTREALQNIVTLPERISPATPESVAIGPDYRYFLLRRPSWTSPPCRDVGTLDSYGGEGWSVLVTDPAAGDFSLDEFINVTGARGAGLEGGGVSVAVLDTGFGSFDVFDCPQTPFDDQHGTLVSNLIKTIAPDSPTPSELVCKEDGTCETYEIVVHLDQLEGSFLATGQKTIANLSLAGAGGPDVFIDYVLYNTLANLAAKYPDNFLVVAAAGNNGLDDDPMLAATPLYPAAFSAAADALGSYPPIPNIMSVGAAGLRKETGVPAAADFNPRGVGVDLLGPGVRLCFDESGCDAEGTLTGTSFATAVVSGVAALTWQQCPDLGAQELKRLLQAKGSATSDSDFVLVNADPNYDCDGNPAEVGIRIEPANALIPRFGQQELTVVVTGTLETDVTWTLDSGTILGDGNTVTFEAPSKGDTYLVTATSVADPSKSATAEVAVSTDFGNFSFVKLITAEVNGVTLTPLQRTVRVAPGEEITGTVELAYSSAWPPSATLAFGAAPNWGDPAESLLDWGVIPPGEGTISNGFSFTAPTEPGSYYIVFAFGGELTAAQVFSMTNWFYEENYGGVLWNDGNDITEWGSFLDAINIGHELGSVLMIVANSPEYVPVTAPATAIEIVVE